MTEVGVYAFGLVGSAAGAASFGWYMVDPACGWVVRGVAFVLYLVFGVNALMSGLAMVDAIGGMG